MSAVSGQVHWGRQGGRHVGTGQRDRCCLRSRREHDDGDRTSRSGLQCAPAGHGVEGEDCTSAAQSALVDAGGAVTEDDRVLIFRAVGMSVWAFGAGPVPPTAAQKKKMAAIRRRFVLSGKVPAGDGEAAFTTHSKVSGDELARPVANGGSSLPTIGHWLDELNVARVLRLLDPVEQTQKWTYFVLHWAAERIGVWGARAATGPAPNKATLAVSQFLTRYKEATNVLTSSKYMPVHWQARFRSFFRAMQRTMIMPIVGTAEARSEPLWHNSLIQTGRGVWERRLGRRGCGRSGHRPESAPSRTSRRRMAISGGTTCSSRCGAWIFARAHRGSTTL